MTMIDDGQTASVANGKADAAAVTAGSLAQGAHASAVQTFVSGTAKQVDPVKDAYLYLNVTTASSLAIAVGPTSAAATVLNAAEADALGLITLFVPGGWYVKLTGTMGNIVATSVLV